MAAASAVLALPLKILNFSSVNDVPYARSGERLPAPRPGAVCPREGFSNENLVPWKRPSGSARLRWVSENSEHRRPATRQRGFCGSFLEQPGLDLSQPRKPRENGRLEIIRGAFLQRAPAQSAETPYSMGRHALCQLRTHPAVGVARAHAGFMRGDDDHVAFLTVRQRVNLVPPAHSQRPASEEKERDIGAQPGGDLHKPLQRDLLARQAEQSQE